MLKLEEQKFISEQVKSAIEGPMKSMKDQQKTFFTFASLLIAILIAFVGYSASLGLKNSEKIGENKNKIENNQDCVISLTRVVATEHPTNAFIMDLLSRIAPQRGASKKTK